MTAFIGSSASLLRSQGRAVRWARGLLSWQAVGLVLLFVVAALAPVLAIADPLEARPDLSLRPPTLEHPFGTDSFGFDVYTRVLYATRTDLAIALVSVLLGACVGVPIGLFGAYSGGWVDDVLSRFLEVFQSVPQILLAMLVFAIAGNSPMVLVIVIAALNAAFYARLVRAPTLQLKDAEFVLAARVVGHGAPGIVFGQLLPNVLPSIFVQFSVSAAFAVLLVAGLSFIGLGVRVPEPEWGAMIQLGAPQIAFGQWWPAIFPCLAIVFTAWCLAGVGERARQMLRHGTDDV